MLFFEILTAGVELSNLYPKQSDLTLGDLRTLMLLFPIIAKA